MRTHKEIIEEVKRREYYNSMSPFPVYDTEIINDLKKYAMITKKDGYDSIPVTYCKTCLSLHIKTVEFEPAPGGEDRNVSYCVPCGNTDLGEVNISEWEEMYEERYGKNALKGNK